MKLTITTFLLLTILSLSFAQKASPLSGEHILKNIAANYAGIQDYTVALDVAVDLERLKVPKMKAIMYFKQPDKVHFESEGFALLPKEGLGFTPGSLSSRFDVESVKEEAGASQYTLSLKLKADRTGLRRAIAVINSKNWTVALIQTPRSGGRQMKAEFEYQRIENHWLPAQLTVTIAPDTTEIELPDTFGQLSALQRPSQMPRKGTITIRYLEYKINLGLSNEIFHSK